MSRKLRAFEIAKHLREAVRVELREGCLVIWLNDGSAISFDLEPITQRCEARLYDAQSASDELAID